MDDALNKKIYNEPLVRCMSRLGRIISLHMGILRRRMFLFRTVWTAGKKVQTWILLHDHTAPVQSIFWNLSHSSGLHVKGYKNEYWCVSRLLQANIFSDTKHIHLVYMSKCATMNSNACPNCSSSIYYLILITVIWSTFSSWSRHKLEAQPHFVLKFIYTNLGSILYHEICFILVWCKIGPWSSKMSFQL
jgi:hypothetical protein